MKINFVVVVTLIHLSLGIQPSNIHIVGKVSRKQVFVVTILLITSCIQGRPKKRIFFGNLKDGGLCILKTTF